MDFSGGDLPKGLDPTQAKTFAGIEWHNVTTRRAATRETAKENLCFFLSRNTVNYQKLVRIAKRYTHYIFGWVTYGIFHWSPTGFMIYYGKGHLKFNVNRQTKQFYKLFSAVMYAAPNWISRSKGSAVLQCACFWRLLGNLRTRNLTSHIWIS